MARNYKWQVPMKALQALTSGTTPPRVVHHAEISERSESLCRWEVSTESSGSCHAKVYEEWQGGWQKGEATNLFASQCRSLGMEV